MLLKKNGANIIKKIFFLAALIAAAAGGWWHYSSDQVPTDDTRIKGTIVPISSKIKARITEVNVENGTIVKKGMVLARLDSSGLSAQLNEADAALAAARARLAAAEAGSSEQEIAQAGSDVDEAAAALKDTQKDYARISLLFTRKAVSRQQLDTAKKQLDAAKAAVNAASQKYALAQAGSRPEDISCYKDQVTQAESAAENLQYQMQNTVIRASADGFIDAKTAEIGQTAVPGLTLFNIAALNDI